MERNKYINAKVKGNNTEHLYLVDALWIKKWINFVKYSSAPNPGPIINDSVYFNLESNPK
jgi:hypothetical protein